MNSRSLEDHHLLTVNEYDLPDTRTYAEEGRKLKGVLLHWALHLAILDFEKL